MIKANNWPSYQSYKDRKPPWIRLHKSLIDDYEYQLMSADARALLPMLWLMASEDSDPKSGLVTDSIQKIAFRLRISEEVVTRSLHEIIDAGFFVIDQACNETVTKPLRDRSQTVTPETETETETPPPLSPPRKKAKSRAFKKPTPAEVDAYSASRPDKPDIPGDEFCDSYEAKGWRIGKSPMKDWKAAVRTWESNRKREINNAAHQQIPGRRQTETEIHGKIYRDMLASQLGDSDIREDANSVSPALDEIAWN